MGQKASSVSRILRTVQWKWLSNPNSQSDTEPSEWSDYSDVENYMIEQAFLAKQTEVILDGCCISFENGLQISNSEPKEKRPVRRIERRRDGKCLREARFVDVPTGSGRPFGGEYGWISPFIIEVRRQLKLQANDLPSNNPSLIPELVEKAAIGIVNEGKSIGKGCEAQELAAALREYKNKSLKEIWECCAYIYSLESFLYRAINSCMRLIGDKDHRQEWRSKVMTLGPFCLLFWDDPSRKRLKIGKTIYRSAMLTEQHIEYYKKLATNKDAYGSFQAFTSCTRNREKIEELGNTLFIIQVIHGFLANLSSVSEYEDEEETLAIPGVCFNVQSVEMDSDKNKYIITIKLKQRCTHKDLQELEDPNKQKRVKDAYEKFSHTPIIQHTK